MRIVIDMQGAQSSGSRNRGIGRYVLSLALVIVQNRGEHEVYLALNGSFPESVEAIRAAFDGFLPQENIRVWWCSQPVAALDDANIWRRESAQLLREAFLASLRPDVVLITSLFEGLIDDAVTSIGALSTEVPTVAILYDLIPYIHRKPYLENPRVSDWYLSKIAYLRKVNLCLAISESSRQEGMQQLGFSAQTCVNISSAVDAQFLPQKVKESHEKKIRSKYGLYRQFVMYTGGIDFRKNIERLICAYAQLPDFLRLSHQLAIVCSIGESERYKLLQLTEKQGLKKDDLLFTGFVPEDDLLVLYNLCKVFVFPSWHEGFGLPVLEAMSCGRAVIGANTSSIPEVIGRVDALFDPYSEQAITEKLAQVLSDDAFRESLERHGLKQAKLFSWKSSAQRALAALEVLHANNQLQLKGAIATTKKRPKLAYVSPLPPQRSGISDYSAELLPELLQYYDIDAIVAQNFVSDEWINANCLTRSVEWFKQNAGKYDRVLYHFGNSAFHQHMFELVQEVPGMVVLHDFFLSGVVAQMDVVTGYALGMWVKTLYEGHGYAAVKYLSQVEDSTEVEWRYPCNVNVLNEALGVIVHSKNSCALARQWYGQHVAQDWAVIPLLRRLAIDIDRAEARKRLGIKDGDFVICSFGLLGPIKLNQRLLDAWQVSCLARDENCVLVFVGENHTGAYGAELVSSIKKSGFAHRIRISGWVSTETFRDYLASADMAVQLRTFSRGETSAAVLDCMNYGIPTIVNANGSMADLPGDGVYKLPDDFSDLELKNALGLLWRDSSLRHKLAQRAREIVITQHAPRSCAEQYVQAIEKAYSTRGVHGCLSALTSALAHVESLPKNEQPLIELAQAVDHSFAKTFHIRQLLVDVSELVKKDSKTGIQRVVRSILNELLMNPPNGFRVELVYADVNHSYRYARQFTANFLGCRNIDLPDDCIEFRVGDVFLGLDFQPHVVSAQRSFYQTLRNAGLLVKFVVYDLLPITLPHAFLPDFTELHEKWLTVVVENDGAICISKAVADELSDWCKQHPAKRFKPFKISWFHLGSDLTASSPSKGMPENAKQVLNALEKKLTFLMVGTLEPRKGHAQTIAAFELLWAEGHELNLVIVGKQGWAVDTVIAHLRQHPELNQHLFWLEGISDEYLEKVYAVSDCLIAASEGEGFGLPIIEAAQHNLPIIARDILIFREVAGSNVIYFSGNSVDDLKNAVLEWLELHSAGAVPSSSNVTRLSWQQSAKSMLEVVLNEVT